MKRIGLWIDHKIAYIVTVKDGKTQTQIIHSNLGERVKIFRGSRDRTPYGSKDVNADDKRQRNTEVKILHFYDSIVATLNGSDAILIFGPGEAKLQLMKRIRNKDLRSRVRAVETEDRMTETEIIKKVRQHFLSEEPAAMLSVRPRGGSFINVRVA